MRWRPHEARALNGWRAGPSAAKSTCSAPSASFGTRSDRLPRRPRDEGLEGRRVVETQVPKEWTAAKASFCGSPGPPGLDRNTLKPQASGFGGRATTDGEERTRPGEESGAITPWCFPAASVRGEPGSQARRVPIDVPCLSRPGRGHPQITERRSRVDLEPVVGRCGLVDEDLDHLLLPHLVVPLRHRVPGDASVASNWRCGRPGPKKEPVS
jgi:hypothetical protein